MPSPLLAFHPQVTTQPAGPIPAASLDATQPVPVDERSRTAFHEAGHFVVAHVLASPCLRIRSISIVENDHHAGHLDCVSGGIYGWADAQDVCAILLAGFYAETRFAGRPQIRAATTDLTQAEDVVRSFCERPLDAFKEVREIVRRTVRLLDVHWLGVRAVAMALMEMNRVPAPLAAGLVESLRPKPPPLPRRWPPDR